MNVFEALLLGARSDLLLAAGLLIAVFITIHILLRHLQVPSAAGWIGLVWFAPFTGGILYLMFGINRVERRAKRNRPAGPARDSDPEPDPLDRDGHLQLLSSGIGRISGRAILKGNAVQLYENGDEAYPPMLGAIGEARRSIGLSSYIFRDDEWGGRFIDALTAARGRGVEVRVLIDGVGGGWLRSPAYHRLRRNEVPAARFFHSLLPWRMPFVNLRSHKKILVVDGRVGFTGGMNISDQNVMATRPKEPVQDTHFRIEGPLVAQLVENFAEDWAFTEGETLDGDAWFPDVPKQDGPPGRMIDSGPDEDIEKVEFAILEAVACAQKSIQVMTPYFLPDERLTTALALAAMRGIAVDVVIPEQSDHIFVDWATRANVGPLLGNGVRIWQCPPPFRHSKMMVVDGAWCLIGSTNWDIRSFRLNFEMCVEFYGEELCGRLQAEMARARGKPLTPEMLEARSRAIRLRDAAARMGLPYL